MKCIVLDGKALAAQIASDLASQVASLTNMSNGRVPTLATILVGNDPASATYVRMKLNACAAIGMDSRAIVLSSDTTTVELLEAIDALNGDETVDGILLQHPVPDPIDERACFDRIDIRKDVDGVTSAGFGKMALGMNAFGAATPAGIMRLLGHYGISLRGKHAVVLGRSPILGKPMAAMLTNADATVTLCHSHTPDLGHEVRRADIIVAAVGRPHFVKANWIKDGAVVVDAGYHPGGIGDVEPDGLLSRCAAVTPVPGGVGPMTISTLISQTLEAATRANSK
ncbi:tetrahydrofolate dehydrogenase/cyclohydrolase catalytic domain-containing protein [Caballeronia sp. GAWG2-1]|uniref:bifunctional 5,10-methylenetetrahydrofolate dehydrogenase/5,10-methenyltetrahydrofolate cyclohydrolase n=1 Tax=Caballeronia sp. GAWG2-1 TaxID=2921744 RepID=UPI0020294347|nr:tetrahydrofolate dehydrogenase/cyclohydrolase catalytic domain-containing protein [Caballeronia sp. GAWG2-1]